MEMQIAAWQAAALVFASFFMKPIARYQQAPGGGRYVGRSDHLLKPCYAQHYGGV